MDLQVEGTDNTLDTLQKSARTPEELTIVVSVTEPKLLIKILHVTFTGGPVEWNDSDMTGESLKRHHQDWLWGVCVGGGVLG